MNRSLDALADQYFDLAIIGGGITGAGVAREATLRSWRVALIDGGDFAGGTSSASSKLIHGGLRYLEQGHFSLVSEALEDRRWLVDHAPHLVRPLQFTLPFYRGARVPSWKWRLGLALYDFLAAGGNLRRGRPLTAAAMHRGHPGLKSIGLLGGAAYSDAQMDDARLCLEVILSACRDGAVAANYLPVIGLEKIQGRIRGVWAKDRQSGREILIRARQVLNATGPWVDSIRRMAGEASGPSLQPTKGVHLLAPGRKWTSAMLLLHPRDGRVFFVIPWMGKTLIGTTDTFTPARPDELQVTSEDVAYLQEGFNAYFQPGLSSHEVLGAFAGLRPLLKTRPGEPSAISREWRLWQDPSGLWSVAGGKYTTFRSMARRIVNEMSKGNFSNPAKKSASAWRLVGTPTEPWAKFLAAGLKTLREDFQLPLAASHHLLGRYGLAALEVAKYRDQTVRTIWPNEPDLAMEIPYQRDHEMALFPADHFLRRMRLGMYCPGLLESPPEWNGKAA